MSSTLDYASNIQILSRITRKLKENDGGQPQEDKQIDIFDRIERLSYDFVLRLRKYELEHSQDEVMLSAVSSD